MISDIATRAVVTVGTGRGFVVQSNKGTRDRLIITAAHCLPEFPPCHGAYAHERTYQGLLAPLGDEPSVWTECLFADPIGDIAVLGPPDGQQLLEQWEAYDNLVSDTLTIADAPKQGPAWLLSLDNRWFRCTVRHSGGSLWISDAKDGIRAGMSGHRCCRMTDWLSGSFAQARAPAAQISPILKAAITRA